MNNNPFYLLAVQPDIPLVTTTPPRGAATPMEVPTMRPRRPDAAVRRALTSAIAADRPVAQRVLWLAAGVLALGWFVAVRAAFGDPARGADAVRPGAAAH